MKKHPVRKRPKTAIKKVEHDNIISNSKLQSLAKKSAYIQHQSRLADFRYKQQLIREFKKAYEDYIG
jgi:hypothetical protein